MMESSKKICIIGSGASGITAIKCCLDEGLQPTCYEMNQDIGGLWRYEENERNGACVYKSTIINSSKEMMAYSDYPIPKEFPNFMHNTKIFEYFKMYCKEFNLFPYIHFNTEVVKCELSEDYEETGRWFVTTKDKETNQEKSEIFDGILVCVGHHATPNFPTSSFAGIDKFQGDITHSHSYRVPNPYENKRVVVIGVGNSGGDIAVELGKCSKKTILSTRRGAWCVKRLGINGEPGDAQALTRMNNHVFNLLPKNVASSLVEKQLNENFDHAKYGMKPKHRFYGQHPLVNDSLSNSILSGAVIIKGNISEFTETGVIFEDGTSEEVDAVIFATGYIFKFPFFDESIIKVRENRTRLYRLIWPPHLKHGTMAVIGGIQPLGSVMPISEIQSRWATRVIKGLSKLPQRDVMEKAIDEKIVALDEGYYKSPRHTLQVFYINYMDEIAEEIGVKPDVFKLLKTDFKLGLKVLFGPCTPYQYRLQGPGIWPNAKEAIMTQQERIDFPLSSRKVPQESASFGWLLKLSIVFIIIVIMFYK